MTLKPLLEIAKQDPAFQALGGSIAPGGGGEAHVSAGLKPLILAALADDGEALGSGPVLFVAADDRGARDLARELGAFLAPRRVRYYPSRGTGYESHLVPPPHLVGLRIAALDALARGEEEDHGHPIVVASAVALAEAVPDASLRPAGFSLSKDEEVDLEMLAELLAGAGYGRVDQVEDRGQFAIRGDILDVFGATEDRAARVELWGDEIESIRYFSTFTQRSLGDTDRIELDPAAEIDPDHRILAEAALEERAESGQGEEGSGQPLAELLPTDQFSGFLDLISPETIVVNAAAEDLDAALSDHLTDVRAAIHDDDVAALYVEVSEPLAERASLRVSSREADLEHSFRASTPVSAARSLAEAEPELEKQLRSGYVTVVCFERQGDADRARYNLDRVSPLPLRAGEAAPTEPAVYFTEGSIGEGFIAPSLKLAVIPIRKLVHRRRSERAAPTRGKLATIGDLAVGEYVVH